MVYFYILVALQIITESFPISSSGHVTLLLQYLHLWGIPLPTLVDTQWFNHFLHVPTVCIVAFFFKNKWITLLRNIRRCRMLIVRTILCVGIADLVTGLFYVMFKVIGNQWFSLEIGFCITIIALYSTRFCVKNSTTVLSIDTALIIGCVQGFALLPGISRLGITYATARMLAFSPQRSFALSWMVMWPLIAVASVHGAWEFYWYTGMDELLRWQLWLVMLGAAVIAWCGMCIMSTIVQKNKVWLFALYMLLPLSLWAWRTMS